MKYNYLIILFLILSFAIADIPDVTLSWDTFFIIKIDNIENILDFFLSDSVYPQNEAITPFINGAYLVYSVKTTSSNNEIHISKFNQNDLMSRLTEPNRQKSLSTVIVLE